MQASAEQLPEFVPEISGCLPDGISAEEPQNTVKRLAEAADIPAHRAGSSHPP